MLANFSCRASAPLAPIQRYSGDNSLQDDISTKNTPILSRIWHGHTIPLLFKGGKTEALLTRLRRHRRLTASESAREVRVQDLFENAEASRCFDLAGDLWLEVGTGKDSHILERSLRHPETLHLGIEQTRKKFEMMLRKADMLNIQRGWHRQALTDAWAACTHGHMPRKMLAKAMGPDPSLPI